MRWRLAVGGFIVGSLISGVAAVAGVASLRWNRETGRSVNRFYERLAPAVPPYSHDDLTGLPEPVVRYFEFALRFGQRVVRTARFRQSGFFAAQPNSWKPFLARQYFSIEPPGFVWDATIASAALLPTYVRDGYASGEGSMLAKVAGVATVANQHGSAEMASSALLRYLAEAVLFPTALLPRDGVSWKSVDGSTARVTLAHGAQTVSCDVSFGMRGDIQRVAAMRYRDVAGRPVLTPWIGHWHDYRRFDGMMIPTIGEAVWETTEGPHPYWRGRIEDARYEYGDA